MSITEDFEDGYEFDSITSAPVEFKIFDSVEKLQDVIAYYTTVSLDMKRKAV